MSLGWQSLWGIAVKGFSIVVGFLLVAILARVLSPTEYGIYSVVLALLTVLTVPTALGLPNYVVREVAAAMGRGGESHDDTHPQRARQVVRSAAGLVLAISGGMVLSVAGWAWISGQGDTYRATLWLGLALIPGMALTQVMGAGLRGMGRSTAGLLVGLVLRQGVLILLLIGWLLLIGTPGTRTAMGLHALGSLAALVLGVRLWLRTRPSLPEGAGPPERIGLRTMLMSTGVMGIIAGAQTLNANLDVIMLGALRDAESAGLYKLGSTAALLTVAGLQAINMVMMPHFARLYREGDQAKLQRLATKSVRMILLTAVPATLLLVLAGKPIIRLAFGEEYLDSYTPMVILMAGQLVSAMFGSVISILNMTGHEVDTMKGVLTGTAVNIVLNVALIPPFGTIGAAIATAATLVAWNLYLHALVRKRLSINSTPFPFLNVAR